VVAGDYGSFVILSVMDVDFPRPNVVGFVIESCPLLVSVHVVLNTRISVGAFVHVAPVHSTVIPSPVAVASTRYVPFSSL
jgi:hypothetical protein